MDQYGDDLAAADVFLPQIPGDPVGNIVDLAIAPLLLTDDKRRSIRVLFGLHPEHRYDII